MPTERLSMRQIREVLRLHYSVGMSQRTVACSLGLAQGTVSKYVNRTRRAGLTWPLPTELDDDVRLENRLYPPPSDLPSDERPHPDWSLIHRELRRPNVTLMLLWEEYCDTTSDGFSYSWFCERYTFLMTRKSFGLMMRKLSVTIQRSAQFPGTFSRRKLSAASANWAQVA